MDILKRYFTKRYFLFFCFLFLLWYPGSFFLYIGYSVTRMEFIHVAMNLYFPLLMFIFSFLYFRKSINDWNDRLCVAFGWIALSFIFSALLVNVIYGFDWTSVMNLPQIEASWSPFLAVLLAGMILKWIEKKKRLK